MKIIADENMPMVRDYFSHFGDVQLMPGRLMRHHDLRDADALLVRSVTKVNAALLENTPVRFVGTATIGVDHIDTEYLAEQGISLCSAPGCNAQAVVDYICAALLRLERLRGLTLTGKTVGVVGLGNVGGRLKNTLERMGLSVLACDPLLAEQGEPGLVPFHDLLDADILSFHTPLTVNGAYPTYHMVDLQVLNRLKEDVVLINAARGSVIDNRALSQWLEAREAPMVVLDVWEGEPMIDRELAQRVDIATPHIAGYSFDGKLRGTDQVYRGFCAWQGVPANLNMRQFIPSAAERTIDLVDGELTLTAASLVDQVYDIMEDDLNLRSALTLARERRVAAFDQLRKHYKMRREFAQVTLRHFDAWSKTAEAADVARVQALGFAGIAPS